MDKVKEYANKAFSAGLGKGGRAAAWATAIGGVVAWSWYENRDNGQVFSKDEQKSWNAERESKTSTGKSS
eukprot:CAMPEP_0176186662 /NCGR_PEP_ID=MMETSP0121_2-20121125/1986_1 /TAXON_ID=160619 /ORGANISM="Kryptoperidinium foliaceum, Strain CCMP 1326" /LENGTH=69 /DNA_ID=CAMNT_0017525155 /DNA_START=76 /DNA_END=285 /DNA_ORIENTATION=+